MKKTTPKKTVKKENVKGAKQPVKQDVKKTYVVTGSAGFIGFFVSKRLLENGHTVVGVDNMNDYYDVILKKKRNAILQKFPNYHFYKIHLEDTKKVKSVFDAHEVHTVIHLGAQAGVRYSMENPWQYANSNYIGSLNIFEAAKNKGISHVISASSSSVYGNSKPPYHEQKSVTDTPISVYAATKKGVEALAHTYTHLYPMTIVNLRFFTVYGPWSRPDMAMLKFAQKIISDEKIVLYNQGKMKRGFTYVEDIVDGVLAAEHVTTGYHVVNLGGNEIIALNKLVSTLEKHLGKKAIVELGEMQKGDVKDTIAVQDHARKKLQFNPKVSFDMGVKAFCEWFLEHKNWLLKLKKAKQ